MGREIKMVPLDFDWPLRKRWKGYVMPENLRELPCPCKSGYNEKTAELAEHWSDNDGFVFVEGNVCDWNDESILEAINYLEGRWTYKYGIDPNDNLTDNPPWKVIGDCLAWHDKLTQDEVDALVEAERLTSYTHDWNGEKWVKKNPYQHPTAERINHDYVSGFGHDCINKFICIKTRATRLGFFGYCEICKGKAYFFRNKKHEEENEAWECTEPPVGEAYQIWETVSEGSPVSPPFLKPEDLAKWMLRNDDSVTKDSTFEDWIKFITKNQWAPSAIGVGKTLKSGVAGQKTY